MKLATDIRDALIEAAQYIIDDTGYHPEFIKAHRDFQEHIGDQYGNIGEPLLFAGNPVKHANKTTMSLTGKQAAMIAEFAGYTVSEETDPMVTDMVQVIVQDTDGTPITEDDGSITKHRTIVYAEEAEEEGICSLDSGDPGGLV